MGESVSVVIIVSRAVAVPTASQSDWFYVDPPHQHIIVVVEQLRHRGSWSQRNRTGQDSEKTGNVDCVCLSVSVYVYVCVYGA